MAPIPNPRVQYLAIPDREIVIGKHIKYDDTHTIDLESVPLKGGFLTKTLLLSPEPYMRFRMRDKSVPGYSSIYKLNSPVVGFGVVEVVRSEDEKYKVGDRMLGMTPWEAYTVQPYIESRNEFDPKDWPSWTVDFDQPAYGLQVVPAPPPNVTWAAYCGIFGIPGLVSYFGVEAYLSDAKPGQKIYVSAAAGACGSYVVQLAKLKGLFVIGSAGTDEKLKWLKELGVDEVFNYKKESPAVALKRLGPIDIFWDNVGGPTLEAAIDNSNHLGKIIICGGVSEYNSLPEERYGIKNTVEIFYRRLTVHGLLMADHYQSLAQKFFGEVPALVATNKLQVKETVVKGLDKGPQALLDVFNSTSTGKLVVEVADY